MLHQTLAGVVLAFSVVASSHAMEAVAQQGYGFGNGQGGFHNAALDSKVSGLSAIVNGLTKQVSTLRTSLTEVLDCNAEGKVWSGNSCLVPGPVSGTTCNDGSDGKDAETAKKLLVCNAKGKFYDPTNANADADGCFCSTACVVEEKTLKSYVAYMQNPGSWRSVCSSTNMKYGISEEATALVLDSVPHNPGAGVGVIKTNCWISNQGGSLTKAKFRVKAANGAVIYESPTEKDCGENTFSFGDGQGNSTTNINWIRERRIELPTGKGPFTLETEGYGCMGWSANALTTFARISVTEVIRTTKGGN